MAKTYTREQKERLYTLALNVLSTYDIKNAAVSKFIESIIDKRLEPLSRDSMSYIEKKNNKKEKNLEISFSSSTINKLGEKLATTFENSFNKKIKKVSTPLSTLFNTFESIQRILSKTAVNTANIREPNKFLSDTQGSVQEYDVIRSTPNAQTDRPVNTALQVTPNSALADIKGSSQALDLIRDDEVNKQVIDGFTQNGKKDLQDALKGVMECVCDKPTPQAAPTPVPSPAPKSIQQSEKNQQPNSTGILDKILFGAGLAYTIANVLKRVFTKPNVLPVPKPAPKPPVEVPKPAPKPPVEVPKPAPKPAPKVPVEVPKPAPKPPVEVPKPAPKPPVEVPKPAPKPAPKVPVEVPKPAPKPPVEVPKPAPKPPVEVPKPKPTKVPKLDEVIPKIKIPLPPEPPKPWEPKTPTPSRPPYKPTPKLEDVVPKVKIPPSVTKPIEREALEAGAKTAEKIGAKQGAKIVGKKLPFGVGALIAGGLAADRALAGDLKGAGLEIASGAASIIPGVGTVSSLAIDAAIYARDVERAKETGNVGDVIPETNNTLPAPKPSSVPAPKPIVEFPKPIVEAPKPVSKSVISSEEAEQIRKNVENQVKDLKLDPKYLLASTKVSDGIALAQNTPLKTNKVNFIPDSTSRELENTTTDVINSIKIAGFSDNAKKEIRDIIHPPLREIANKIQQPTSTTTTTTKEALPSTFTSKLLDTLPQNKLTKSLKFANRFREDFKGAKEEVKQRVQNKVLNKVSNIFNEPSLSSIPSTNKNVSKTIAIGLGKQAPEVLGKTAGKSLLKKIPGVGALAGLGFAANRLLSGDISGAGLELASGVASTIPGLGTVGSAGLDAVLAAKDMQTPQQRVEQVGDAAKKPDSSIKPDGGLVIKSPRENSLFKPIQLSKNDGFIAAPFANENKVDTQSIAMTKDTQLPVLRDILKGTEGNNEYLSRLADAIFNLAKNVNNNTPSVSQPIFMQQPPAIPQRTASQIANANVDPIRLVRSKFNV